MASAKIMIIRHAEKPDDSGAPFGVDIIGNAESFLSTIENHVENFVNGIMQEVPDNRTPKDAVPFMKDKILSFLGR